MDEQKQESPSLPPPQQPLRPRPDPSQIYPNFEDNRTNAAPKNAPNYAGPTALHNSKPLTEELASEEVASMGLPLGLALVAVFGPITEATQYIDNVTGFSSSYLGILYVVGMIATPLYIFGIVMMLTLSEIGRKAVMAAATLIAGIEVHAIYSALTIQDNINKTSKIINESPAHPFSARLYFHIGLVLAIQIAIVLYLNKADVKARFS